MRHFIRFIILTLTNSILINQQEQHYILQNKGLDAILFCICFLRDELGKTESPGLEYIQTISTNSHILFLYRTYSIHLYREPEKHFKETY